MTSNDAMLEAGLAALAAGDLAAAHTNFLAAQSSARVPWMALAEACYKQGDMAGERLALAERIKVARGDIGAILAMADSHRGNGDTRAAFSFYSLALATARQMASLPQELQADLAAAQAYVTAAQREFSDGFFARLRHAGMTTDSAPPRVAEALRVLNGDQPLYQQQPSMFYFPGLVQRPWWDARDFDWAADMEAETDAIAAELDGLLGLETAFTPYVTASDNRPPPNNPLLDKPDWGAAWLLKSGEVVADMDAACPRTLTALKHAPQPVIPGRAPLALFSRLKPGTHILPHMGMLNTRLICHLPLIVPDGCALRVAGETRAWQRGRLAIFDDSFEHEAWNRGSSDRTVLLFEIWRPDLDAEERTALTEIFAAIDGYDVN